MEAFIAILRKVDLSDLIIGGALAPGMSLFPRRKKYSHRVATLLPDGKVEPRPKAVTGVRCWFKSQCCHPLPDHERDGLTGKAAFVNAAMTIHLPKYRALTDPRRGEPGVERPD
jgi:hypothetical protein